MGKPVDVEIGDACTYGVGAFPNDVGSGAIMPGVDANGARTEPGPLVEGAGTLGVDANGCGAYPGELVGAAGIAPPLLRTNDAATRAIRSSVNAAAGGANGVSAAANSPMLA